jgi:predicted TIM-barrel enzyme
MISEVPTMGMTEIATIAFVDRDSNDDAVVIVRAGDDLIYLTLSLRHNGDLAVVFSASECKSLVEALQEACSYLSGGN